MAGEPTLCHVPVDIKLICIWEAAVMHGYPCNRLRSSRGAACGLISLLLSSGGWCGTASSVEAVQELILLQSAVPSPLRLPAEMALEAPKDVR